MDIDWPIVEIETPFETEVDESVAAVELETKTDVFFAVTLESVVEDFLAEKDLALAIDLTILLFSSVDSETFWDSSWAMVSFSSLITSPVFAKLDFLSSANSSPDTFFILLLTVSCIRFDRQPASVLALRDLLWVSNFWIA